jgi:hypothetical protein
MAVVHGVLLQDELRHLRALPAARGTLDHRHLESNIVLNHGVPIQCLACWLCTSEISIVSCIRA